MHCVNKACFTFPDDRQLTWYEAGQGRPLVLLHGWAMSAAVFGEVVSLLSADFRLLVPDLPGHGGSSPALGNELTLIAADLACWLNATVQEPFALAGWSLGGMLALEMAHQQKLPVDRLILIGTTPRFTTSGDWSFGLPTVQVQALARNLMRRFETTLADFFALAFAGENISTERLRTISSFAVKQSPLPEPTMALGLLTMLASQDQRDILSEVHQPALVLHGEIDQITPVAAGEYLANVLPQGTFVEFPGVGHGLFLSQPHAAAATIRAFL